MCGGNSDSKGEVGAAYLASTSLDFTIPSAVASIMANSLSSMLPSIRSMCFRRSFSISHWAGKKNWSIEISNSVAILKRMFKLGCWPRFSIYMMERGVRSRSWAKYSCVQPLSFRLRLISRPKAWKSKSFSN